MTTILLTALALAACHVQAMGADKCDTDIERPELGQEFTDAALQYNTHKRHAINTFIHVITTKEKQGTIPESRLHDQTDVINAAFDGSGLSFVTKNITYTVNDAWATSLHGEYETAYRRELQQGTYAGMDLYFLSDLASIHEPGVLGFCNPAVKNPNEEDFLQDGCVQGTDTLPGSNVEGTGHGNTAIHEIGHWLTLYHTFEGETCEGLGDFIADTPTMSKVTAGCPVDDPPDTCPDLPGLDPIFNFMGYSLDECLAEFAPHQVKRMVYAYETLREQFCEA